MLSNKYGTVVACGMHEYKSTGEWNKLDQGTATATITKAADSDDIYLVAKSIRIQLKIQDDEGWLDGATVSMSRLIFYGHRCIALITPYTHRPPRHSLLQGHQ
ncbi:uncharacterized protein PHACADRAFT_260134 [Phanerochaete carnosa HHB-10118-sp]|uniref:Uncharacterized protein n=1 Tax=Phanerochaete carnosa (strain HHB-10118-sp) TaxID=650164 RepID=K5W3E7_PHACS|nr:uncharacterized protein PHACADRAFT_260134 [Phanerochaete carnosa HHB-10118-sp]EKM53660.1 hypothetical protein PHACADRAFT_260134 [Phanerochaete carnosa HHB-10118-sp]